MSSLPPRVPRESNEASDETRSPRQQPLEEGAAVTDSAMPSDEATDQNDQPLRLTPGWIAVGAAAMALGIAMGFIMSSVWLVP